MQIILVTTFKRFWANSYSHTTIFGINASSDAVLLCLPSYIYIREAVSFCAIKLTNGIVWHLMDFCTKSTIVTMSSKLKIITICVMSTVWNLLKAQETKRFGSWNWLVLNVNLFIFDKTYLSPSAFHIHNMLSHLRIGTLPNVDFKNSCQKKNTIWINFYRILTFESRNKFNQNHCTTVIVYADICVLRLVSQTISYYTYCLVRQIIFIFSKYT